MHLKTYKSIRIKNKQVNNYNSLLARVSKGREINIAVLNKLLLTISDLGKTKHLITLFKSI